MKRIDSRKLSALLILGIVLATLLASVTTAYSQEVTAGQQVFERNCGFCHGLYGQGKFGEPTIAGSAGHLQQFGAPPEAVGEMLTELVRGGIPGNMPMFPPEVLSDTDIANLGAYLLSSPPATGTSIYIASCGRCHGPGGEGIIGPPLQDAPRFIAAQGWTLEEATQDIAGLLRGGIPGRMPSFPQFTDLEIERLVVFLMSFDEHKAWEAEFEAAHGHPPTITDYNDRMWSLEFAARNGRQPTEADWANRWRLEFGGRMGPPQ